MVQKNKTYRFINKCELVKMTPLTEIFDELEIMKIKKLCLKPHMCHWNSAQTAQLFKCEYCEGVFCGLFDHAFNSIERNGTVYYFDVTAFINNQSKPFDVMMLRMWSYKDIFELFRDFKMAFVSSGLSSYNKKIGSFWINDAGAVENIIDTSFVMNETLKRTQNFNKLQVG